MSFISELKRRNVFRVGIAYLITSWLLLQFTDVLSELLNLPDQVGPVVVAIVAIGFPLALFFAWVFELTPEGVKRETDINRSQSVTKKTGKKLNTAILVLMALAIVYLLFDKFYHAQPEAVSNAAVEVAGDGAESVAPPVEEAEPVIPRQSIAVLPFENRSNLEEDVFFVQGIHDDLLTNLARISDLKVISRTTVSQYEGTDKTLPVIASELSVAYIMEGAVQRSGETVRVNVQLIKADSDEHVWAEIFDRQLTAANLFEIQSEISGQIASVLESTLTPQERERINDRPTDNLAAYNAYLRGRQELARYSSAGADQALVEFRRAVELDPNFALAWAGLASSASQGLALSDMNRDEALQITREAATRAIALNDQIAEAQLARAALVRLEKAPWHPEYEEALLRAIELSPGLAEAWLRHSVFLSREFTRGDEALAAAQRAAELDPLDFNIQNQLIKVLTDLGRYAEAEQKLNNLIQLDETFAINYITMSSLKAAQGDIAGELLWRKRAQQRDPGNILFTLGEVWLLTHLGLEERYQDVLDRVEELDPNSSTLAMAETVISLRRGNLDAALEAADAWVRAFPAEDNGRLRWRVTVNILRDDVVPAAEELKLFLGGSLKRESIMGFAKALPQQSCMYSSLIHKAMDQDLGAEMSRVAIDQVDKVLLDHQRRQVNLPLSLCHLVLGDREGALDRIEAAIADGQLGNWWFLLSHPLFKSLALEPRFVLARKHIESAIAKQKERFLLMSREEGL